jgi:basic membrane protein A
MSKKIASGISVAVLALALAACGTDTTPAEPGDSDGDATTAPSVANVINGPLGDQGFFDDAARGMDLMEAAGSKIQNLQADAENPAQWKTNLESVSTGDWDMVITGTSQMIDILMETAPKYPEQSYIIYDSVVELPNVASIVYRQNEGAFLAGVLAAQVTTNADQFPLATGSKKVGFVGGMDIPVINDFAVGFQSGVESVDPSIEVLISYVGDFIDANRGFDQAKAMYDQGADVVFQVAGGAGLGVLRASEDANSYSIGVDSNQNALHPGHILASMLKNIGVSLDSAVQAYTAGTLEFGATTEYGLANNGVSLDFADNEGIVPQEIQDEVQSYVQQVIDGEIEVPTAY